MKVSHICYLSEVLKKNHTLKILGIEFNKITNKGAACIAEALAENSSLVSLNLFDNFIFAQGARLLNGVVKERKVPVNLNLKKNYIDVELEVDIKEVMKKADGTGKTHTWYSNKGYPKTFENKNDSQQLWIATLLAKRLKILCDLKNLHDQPSAWKKKYLNYKHELERNEICLVCNLCKNNREELDCIFGKAYKGRKITIDHVVNIAESLKKRIPEDIENINKLDVLIEKTQSQKQTEGHTLLLGKTSFLKPEDKLSDPESNDSDSENEHNDDTIYTVYDVSEKSANTSDGCACLLF